MNDVLTIIRACRIIWRQKVLIKMRDLWMLSVEAKTNDLAASEENVSGYIGRLCLMLWR